LKGWNHFEGYYQTEIVQFHWIGHTGAGGFNAGAHEVVLGAQNWHGAKATCTEVAHMLSWVKTHKLADNQRQRALPDCHKKK
jgi:hypothetical protein